MKSTDFDKLNFELGQEFLAPLGYKYEKGNWHYLTDEWQLSFVLGKDKNASHFQVKYLTVALRHREVPVGDMKIKLVPYSDIDRGSPIQISPFKLGDFIESEFDSKDWKYANAMGNQRHENTYYPLYYGGEEHNAELRKGIEVFGAELISEDRSINLLSKAMIEVEKYGIRWADYLTPTEVVRQLRINGEKLWVENQWIDAYSETFTLPR